ncbi:MAG: GGDEF domain-containing protein [Pontibacterium sp.]
MKFAENSNKAAEYLRQAIPLMVKHKIPPNPLNYALWYTYVSNKVPELNAELDKALATYGTCPNLIGEQMFREHMIRDEVDQADQVQANLISLASNLHDHATETAISTADYSLMLKESLDALSEVDSDEGLPLESIIQNLSVKTEQISASTAKFQENINAAQKEIESLKAELAKSRMDARIDPLTNLFNRRVFESELGLLLQSGKPDNLCLVMVDIDHFKSFNDTYGHLMGDRVLKYVGQLLRDNCPEPLLPVRYGGEEFALLAPNHDPEKTFELCEGIREKIRAIRIKQKKSGDVISSISASFGIAQGQADESIEGIIERADAALYQAKEQGRDRVIIAA